MSGIVLSTFNWDSVRTSLNCKENTPDTLQNELSQQNDLNIVYRWIWGLKNY